MTPWHDLPEAERKRLPNHTRLETKMRQMFPMVPLVVIKRLRKLEQQNRSRARNMRNKFGHPKRINRVDFVEICVKADFKCCLCREPIDYWILDGMDPKCLSLEHNIAMSGGGNHVKRNISPAHRECNMLKNERHDKGRAAKTKRMAGETGQRARRKRNGSKFKKPAGYVSSLNSQHPNYKKPKWQKRIKA